MFFFLSLSLILSLIVMILSNCRREWLSEHGIITIHKMGIELDSFKHIDMFDTEIDIIIKTEKKRQRERDK